jgi:hypothetical protein
MFGYSTKNHNKSAFSGSDFNEDADNEVKVNFFLL